MLGIIVSIHERKYFQNLLDNNSTQKFQKLKVDKLELKRYVKNTNLGSNISATPSKSQKKEVPLDSNSQDKMGIFNTIENELTVYAICKNTSHEVFTCPFSEENMKYLLQIVNDYNTEKISHDECS